MTVWAKACAGIHGSSHFLRVHLLRFSKWLSHKVFESWREAVPLNSQCNLLWQWKLAHLKIIITWNHEKKLHVVMRPWWVIRFLCFWQSNMNSWNCFSLPQCNAFFLLMWIHLNGMRLLLLVVLNCLAFLIICPSISVQLTTSKIALCQSKIGTTVTKVICVCVFCPHMLSQCCRLSDTWGSDRTGTVRQGVLKLATLNSNADMLWHSK